MNIRQLIDTDALVSARLRLKPGNRWLWRLAVFFAHSGDSWFWFAGLVLVWIFSKGEWHSKSALLALSVGGLAVTVLAIKFRIRRARPEGEWGAIYRNTDPHSFPSGHAARAFMLAVMALLLGPAWFGLVLLVWAPLVSLARVATGVHYIMDVVAGAVLGIVVGYLVVLFQPIIQTILPFLF